ncbi:MAG: LysR family transcriptional regulator [Pseudonocardia sp.]
MRYADAVLLNQLEYLTALARERHFGRAAAACHVSQPALSSAIRKLEQDLRVQVVRRDRRFGGFTPEGEVVLAWAHRILQDRDSLRQELARMAGGLAGNLQIGAIPSALTVSSLLTEPFTARHPAVRIGLESLSSRAIVRRLAEFELDVGMTYVDGEPLGPVRTVPLYVERYLLLAPEEMAAARREEIGWAELAEIPLCLLSQVMQNRRILDRNAAAAGVVLAPSVEADAVSVLYSHVATGRFATVVAHAWLHLFGVPGGMRVVPMAEPAHSYTIGLVLPDRQPGSLLARAFVDVVTGVDLRGELDVLLARHV